ncbi:hypothetical protein HY623_00265 [Candidatus Uhrbacteria bacterium]|nr:hypothetical protein [Candidatus Uhrbacteria bacterium]
MEYRKHPDRRWQQYFAGIVLYLLIPPIVILDCLVEIYHRLCFPILGIPLVKRSQYIRIDRHRLSYLSIWEKINCAYCGYANGLIMYAMRIAGETERYWCSIKHKEDPTFTSPPHHQFFLPYADEQSFKDFLK